MKVEISKSIKYILTGVLLTLLIGVAIYFTRNWLNQQTEIENFKKIKINSRILELKDMNRGTCLIKLNVRDSLVQFYLPISFEVNKDDIRIADSLSKIANSGKCEIFRINDNGSTTKISELIVY